MNVYVRQLRSEEKRSQRFQTVTIVSLIEAKTGLGGLHPETQSSRTTGGVTLEECGPELAHITEATRRRGANPPRTGVSAGFPKEIQLSGSRLPRSPRENARDRERERERRVKSTQTARFKIENTGLMEAGSSRPAG